MPLKAGDTFIMPDSGGNQNPSERHLMVCLLAPDVDGNLLVAPVISLESYSDQTCRLGVGDHPYLKHDSCVGYHLVKKLSSTATDDQINRGYYAPRESVSRDVLQRIRSGIYESDQVAGWAEDYSTSRGLKIIIKKYTPTP